MRGRMRSFSRADRQEALTGFAFLSPWVIGFLAFTLYPMAKALYYSFTQYDLLQPPTWVGLDNYRTAFGNDPLFWQSLGNTAIYALMVIPAGTALSIALAVLLNAKVRGQAVFRTIFYIPSVLPLVATAVVWGWILDPQWGYLNVVLQWFGVQHPPGWLADPTWSKPAFALISIWGIGNGVVIYLAALQGVPQHLYEAASIDGASGLRRFWHITVPMISPAILFNVVLSLIGTFQLFTQPFVLENNLTNGGPGATPFGGPLQSALFYAPYLWLNAFSYFKMGYASALAWVLLLVILACTGVVLWLSKSRVYYEESL